MPDVMVVIPCSQGHLKVLNQAIVSALNTPASKVVVVLDGFPKSRIASYNEGVVLLQTVQPFVTAGVCVSRNVGIEAVTNDSLILPLDADDTLLPGAIEALTAAYEPGTFVYGNWLEHGEEVKSAPPGMLPRKSVAGCTFLFAKRDWQRVGGYDKDFEIGGEDYAFMVALVNAGVRPVRIDVPIYNRTLSDTGRSAKTRQRWPMIQALLREKYPDFFPLAREIYERI